MRRLPLKQLKRRRFAKKQKRKRGRRGRRGGALQRTTRRDDLGTAAMLAVIRIYLMLLEKMDAAEMTVIGGVVIADLVLARPDAEAVHAAAVVAGGVGTGGAGAVSVCNARAQRATTRIKIGRIQDVIAVAVDVEMIGGQMGSATDEMTGTGDMTGADECMSIEVSLFAVVITATNMWTTNAPRFKVMPVNPF